MSADDDLFADLAPRSGGNAVPPPSPSAADDLFADLAPGQGATKAGGQTGADALFADLAPPKPTRNAFAYANDTAIDIANAAAGLAKAGVDLVAPGSAASTAIGGFIESGQQSQSDWKQQQRADLGQKLGSAEGELDKAGIYLKHAVTEDPLGTAAEVAGNVGPFGAVGKALQGANAAVRTGATMGLAGGLSAGEVRGNIFEKIDSTPDADLQASSPEYARLRQTMTEAEAKAEMGGSFERNAPEILAAGAVGAMGGKYGLEGMAARVAPARGRIANAAIGVLDEGSQGAVEQLASNIGVRRALPGQPLMEDVALNAAAEGVLGLGGAAVGPTRGTQPARLPGEDFDVDAALAQAMPPSRQMGLDPGAGPISAAAALAVDSGAAAPAVEPVAVGTIPDAALSGTDSEGGETDAALTTPRASGGMASQSVPTPDFGEFAAFAPNQSPVPLENAQRLAGMLDEDGAPVVVVPNVDGTGFGIAPIDALTPEQHAAVAPFQPAARSWAAPSQDQAPIRKESPASAGAPSAAGAVDQAAALPRQPVDIEAARAHWASMDAPARQVIVERAGLNAAQRRNVPGMRWSQMSTELRARLMQVMQTTAPTTPAQPPTTTGNPTADGLFADLTPTRTVDAAPPATRWAAMTPEERKVVADRAGLNKVQRKNVPSTPWTALNAGLRDRLAQAMQTVTPTARAQQPATTGTPTADSLFVDLRPAAAPTAVPTPRGAPANQADAEGAIGRAGANARVIDTHLEKDAAQQEAPDDKPDPYLNFDTRADTTDAQRNIGRAGLRDLRRRIIGASAARLRGPDGSQVSVLGSALYEGFVAGRANQLTGLRIESPADLANLAQVYRDPRFETFRTIYVKDGRIVGETGLTSRMPAAVALPRPEVFDADIRANMTRFGADGFYVLHNHPSGYATPSQADIRITSDIARSNPDAFRGHIVIDHNEYSVISAGGAVQTVKAPDLAGIDFKSCPELEHELLGVKLSRAVDVAMIGKILQVPNGHATIITTDRRSRVQLLIDLPAALLKDTSKLGIARLKAVVRRAARETGSGGHRFLVLPEDGEVSDFAPLMREGIFADVVQADGFALTQIGVSAGRDFMDTGLRTVAVAEEGSPYPDGPAPPVRLTVGEWASHALRTNRGWALGALTRDQITDIWGGTMPGVRRFDEVVRQMDAARQRIAERADTLIERWRELPATVSDRMSDVMHRATLAKFDPDKNKGLLPPGELADMQRLWDSLPDSAKAVYRDVRDTYRDTLLSIRDGLANRAENAGAHGARVAAQIRLEFDNYLKEGPYFPLARFGDLVLIADKGNERMVETYESSAQRERPARAPHAPTPRCRLDGEGDQQGAVFSHARRRRRPVHRRCAGEDQRPGAPRRPESQPHGQPEPVGNQHAARRQLPPALPPQERCAGLFERRHARLRCEHAACRAPHREDSPCTGTVPAARRDAEGHPRRRWQCRCDRAAAGGQRADAAPGLPDEPEYSPGGGCGWPGWIRDVLGGLGGERHREPHPDAVRDLPLARCQVRLREGQRGAHES